MRRDVDEEAIDIAALAMLISGPVALLVVSSSDIASKGDYREDRGIMGGQRKLQAFRVSRLSGASCQRTELWRVQHLERDLEAKVDVEKGSCGSRWPLENRHWPELKLTAWKKVGGR